MIKPKPRDAISKIKPYVPGRSAASVIAETGVETVIKLASNENVLGCPVTLSDIESDLSDVHVYQNIEMIEPLVKKLAKHLGVDQTQVILGNGSDEILLLIALAYLNPGDELITSEHSYLEYPFMATLMDATLVTVPMKNHIIDLDAMLDAVNAKTKLICIANPNNPTGTMVTSKAVQLFLEKLPSDVVVLLDEAYFEYVDSKDYPDGLSLMKTYPNLIISRTYSKIYGMAGARLGYGIASPEMIQTLYKIRPPFNINVYALKMGECALDHKDHLQKSFEMNLNGKDYLYKALDELGVTYLKTEANFICLFFPDNSAEAIYNALLEKGVIVRHLKSYGYNDGIRVTIGTKGQNQYFIKRLAQVINTTV